MKTFLKQKFVLLAFCLLVMGAQSCSNEKAVTEEVEGFDLETARAEIQAANEHFMALVAAGDSVGLANAYTMDAQFMSAGAPAVRGREAILSAMSGIVQSGITGVDIRLEEVYGTEGLDAAYVEIFKFLQDL